MKKIALLFALLASQVQAEPVGPLSTYLVEPCRFLDTRDEVEFWYEQPGPLRTARLYLVQGSCGIPVGARAIMLNVTATEATAEGHLSRWDLAAPPTTSFLNFAPGRTTSNLTIVPLWEVPEPPGEFADLAIMPGFATPNASVHVVIDVIGYLR